eukprot:5076513-Alexandrium_andersonii.AAC.1
MLGDELAQYEPAESIEALDDDVKDDAVTKHLNGLALFGRVPKLRGISHDFMGCGYLRVVANGM